MAWVVPGAFAFIFGIIGISRGRGGAVLPLVTGVVLIAIASWRLWKSIRVQADPNQLPPGVAFLQRLLGEEFDHAALTEDDRRRGARRAGMGILIGTLCLFAVGAMIGITYDPDASRSATIRHAMIAVGILGVCLLVIGYVGLAVIVVRRRSRPK